MYKYYNNPEPNEEYIVHQEFALINVMKSGDALVITEALLRVMLSDKWLAHRCDLLQHWLWGSGTTTILPVTSEYDGLKKPYRLLVKCRLLKYTTADCTQRGSLHHVREFLSGRSSLCRFPIATTHG